MSTIGAPSPRTHHRAVWTGGEMIIWGGFAPGAQVAGGARYAPRSDIWEPMPNAPTNVGVGATAVWTGEELLLWGGRVPGQGSRDPGTGARWTTRTNSWTALAIAGAPRERRDHVAVWMGTRMIVWGGESAQAALSDKNDGGAYDPVADLWEPIGQAGAPVAQVAATAVWTGQEMLIWGGLHSLRGTYRAYANGGLYAPDQQAWSALPPVELAGRSSHSMVWTGNQAIIWGGTTAQNAFPAVRAVADGAVYTPPC
jgi:hypothetical protein